MWNKKLASNAKDVFEEGKSKLAAQFNVQKQKVLREAKAGASFMKERIQEADLIAESKLKSFFSPPSMTNPQKFVIMREGGVVVRQDISLESSKIGMLYEGDQVVAVELNGRRIRIISPMQGWASIKTPDGHTIMKQVIGSDKEALSVAFENAKRQQEQRDEEPQEEEEVKPKRRIRIRNASEIPDLPVPRLPPPESFELNIEVNSQKEEIRHVKEIREKQEGLLLDDLL